jgi:putative FmdB family regulatory protein
VKVPLYTYYCKDCEYEFDEINSLSDCDRLEQCPKCGRPSKKIICLGYGGVQREDPAWVKSVGESLETKISTIKELRDFYQQHPNIRPKESHPCLPSSIGDVCKPDKVQRQRERKKRALEYLRKKRAITISSAG